MSQGADERAGRAPIALQHQLLPTLTNEHTFCTILPRGTNLHTQSTNKVRFRGRATSLGEFDAEHTLARPNLTADRVRYDHAIAGVERMCAGIIADVRRRGPNRNAPHVTRRTILPGGCVLINLPTRMAK